MKKQRVARNVRKEMDAIEHNEGIKLIITIERWRNSVWPAM